MERIPNENDLIMCPYEPCHMIRRCQMQFHLIRCRKQHKNAEMIDCPFNTTHVIPKPELDWHVKVCEFRKSFEKFKHVEKPIPGLTPAQEPFFKPIVCTEEDWDAEPPSVSYDPIKAIENRDIIRQPVGLTPAQREEFRVNERERIRRVRQQNQRKSFNKNAK